MTAESAVAQLAEMIAAQPEFVAEDLYADLIEKGMPSSVADRAYQFTQTAWSRVFLGGMGVRFMPDYLCFNSAGEVIESGNLDSEPYFAAALRLAPKYAGTPGFIRFVLMSADTDAINSALKKGSQPENLTTSPAALFLEPATPAGVRKAQQVLRELLSAHKLSR